MDMKRFSIRKRICSFRYAFNGLRILFKNEHNSWIHLFATIVVIIVGLLLKISSLEWIIIIACIGGVFALELVNTAIEAIADFISPEKHDMIKKIKDLSAAAVLVVAVAALIIGFIIFLPKFLTL